MGAHGGPSKGVRAGGKGDFRIPPTAGIVINATSIGLYPHVEERVGVAKDSFQPQMIVADVIPNPPSDAVKNDPPPKN